MVEVTTTLIITIGVTAMVSMETISLSMVTEDSGIVDGQIPLLLTTMDLSTVLDMVDLQDRLLEVL